MACLQFRDLSQNLSGTPTIRMTGIATPWLGYLFQRNTKEQQISATYSTSFRAAIAIRPSCVDAGLRNRWRFWRCARFSRCSLVQRFGYNSALTSALQCAILCCCCGTLRVPLNKLCCKHFRRQPVLQGSQGPTGRLLSGCNPDNRPKCNWWRTQC